MKNHGYHLCLCDVYVLYQLTCLFSLTYWRVVIYCFKILCLTCLYFCIFLYWATSCSFRPIDQLQKLLDLASFIFSVFLPIKRTLCTSFTLGHILRLQRAKLWLIVKTVLIPFQINVLKIAFKLLNNIMQSSLLLKKCALRLLSIKGLKFIKNK